MSFESTYLIELDDIGMSDLLEYLDFSSNPFHVLLVLNPVLFKNLDRHLPIVNYEITFSPVSMWVASFTLPNVPLPRDLPIERD